MTESSLSVLGPEDPWNTPSVMAMTPPLARPPIIKEIIPPGSSELQRIMAEMYEEMEMERKIRMLEHDSCNPEPIKVIVGPIGKVLTRIPTRASSMQKHAGFKRKKTVFIND